MAYRAMAVSYFNLTEIGRANEFARKAYDLREKVSERERFSIEGFYYLGATGELDKAAQTYELWKQTYPRDYVPYVNLQTIYNILGNFEKSLLEGREALRLQPDNASAYLNSAVAYLSLNRLEEAEATLKQAEERKLTNENIIAVSYSIAFAKGDTAKMANVVASTMGKQGAEETLLAAQADTEGWYGRLKSGRELTRRAMDLAQRNDSKEVAATFQAAAAVREVETGNREQARVEANAALKLAPNRDVRAIAALALARTGDSAAAEKLVAELDRGYPLDTLVQRYWLPTIRATIALDRNDPNKAIELLKTTSALEVPGTLPLSPAYVRGQAYLTLHDGNRAATEFQKFIDHRGAVANFPWGAVARLGLAQAYVQQGDTNKAKVAYQEFLTIWKDADADVPVRVAAKAEYAKLK
jgi:tetratricopeptide (TPR) repeat protein